MSPLSINVDVKVVTREGVAGDLVLISLVHVSGDGTDAGGTGRDFEALPRADLMVDILTGDFLIEKVDATQECPTLLSLKETFRVEIGGRGESNRMQLSNSRSIRQEMKLI